MTPRFVLDENLRGRLWRVIVRHNERGGDPIDATRVGDPPDLPLGSLDPAILAWAEREGRIVISLDEKTLPTFVRIRLASGGHSQGVFFVRGGFAIRQIVESLALVSAASEDWEHRDRIQYVP